MFAGVFDLYVSFRVLILFLHVLAVLTWVGGLVYQVVVVAPLAKKGAANAAALRVGLACEARFRAVMWPAVGIALFTGLVNVMNVWNSLRQVGASLPAAFVSLLVIKLLLVAAMILLQTGQQFVVYPRRLGLAAQAGPDPVALPAELAVWQRRAWWLHVATVCLAVAVILCALLLRG
jgi:uncharacterized membrane protein